MRTKQKAANLILTYMAIVVKQDLAKECALAAVDEILSVLNLENWGIEMNIAIDELIYWKEVKQEIESL